MTDSTPPFFRPAPPSAILTNEWGLKAFVVCALAFLMAIPGILIFGLVADRSQRAEQAVAQVSALRGGAQTVLGPEMIAPYSLPDKKGAFSPAGWYVVAPDQGDVQAVAHNSVLHRGIFDVPVYRVDLALSARFARAPTAPNLPEGARIDWSHARFALGFSDLRGSQSDVVANYVGNGKSTALDFTPAPDVLLGQPAQNGNGSSTQSPFGIVTAPILTGAAGGLVTARLEFTGAQRLSVLPFAKSTNVEISGDWPSPSFDGGFLPTTRTLGKNSFRANWNVPFMARGLAADGPDSEVTLPALESRDLGVSFAPANHPYLNVMRSLKYGVMFVGLVFLTFFVFEALSGRRVHAAQYVLIGLAQMVFYLLLLSFAEYLGFDLAYLIAAGATVGLIALYAGWVFKGRAFALKALVVFSAVYALSYVLMQLQDFALLVGSTASFIALAAAMYLTRNLDWYGGRLGPSAASAPASADEP
ncbi:MAG: cell envelope integrity protein CreD [Caulobacteraceae bacterium]